MDRPSRPVIVFVRQPIKGCPSRSASRALVPSRSSLRAAPWRPALQAGQTASAPPMPWLCLGWDRASQRSPREDPLERIL